MRKRKHKYIVVDDNPKVLSSLLESLEDSCPGLSFEGPIEPNSDVIESVKVISEKLEKQNAGGIILDLRLDEGASEKGNAARYLAQTLAQALRTEMAVGECLDCPIVLWSISQNIKQKYSRDGLSHDLFDTCIIKNADVHELGKQANLLVGLSEGYEAVRECVLNGDRNFSKLLAPPVGLEVDPQIWEGFSQKKLQVVHRVAMHIYFNLVGRSGPLVSVDVLSARLGIKVDALNSRSVLAKNLKAFEYSGPFSSVSRRWWWAAVLDWWKKEVDSRSPLFYSSSERFSKLMKRFGNRSSIEELDMPVSKLFPDVELGSRFSTVCYITERTLDPVDGFLVARGETYPWLDNVYVCEDVALRPSKYREIRDGEVSIASSESERVKRLKQKIKSRRGRK